MVIYGHAVQDLPGYPPGLHPNCTVSMPLNCVRLGW